MESERSQDPAQMSVAMLALKSIDTPAKEEEEQAGQALIQWSTREH